MNDNRRDAETDELVDRYVAGLLSEEQADRLLSLAQRDPEVGLRMLRQTQLNYLLKDIAKTRRQQHVAQDNRSENAAWTLLDSALDASTLRSNAEMDELARSAARSAEQTSAPGEADRSRPSPESVRRSAVPPAILLVLLATAVLWSFLVYREWNPGTNEYADRSTGYDTPATVVDADDVRWSHGVRSPRLGEPLLPGSLRFDSGTIELLFASGVRGVVEGPAELLLIDEKRVFCKQGRWSVTVPEQGKGFEIQTAGLTIRDIGTRFFADIEGEKTQLHVVRGIVETEKPDGEITRFETAQAAVFRGSELLDRMVSDRSFFVTKSEMRKRSDAVLFRHGPPSAAEAEALRSTAIRTIDFARKSISDATVSGGKIVDGAESGAKAFRFTGPKDCIRVRPVGNLPAMTAVIRMRVDRLDRDLMPILMSEESQKYGLVLQIRATGEITAGIRYQSSRHRGVFESPVVFTDELLGRWVSLAMVFDAQKRSLKLFLEGDPIFSATLPRPVQPKFDTLNFGCWKMHAGENSMIRQINGEIGTLLIFDRTLSPEEIRLLQEH